MTYTTITPGSELYPKGLQAGLPEELLPTLTVRGNADLIGELSTYGLVVDGSRASTGYGEHITMDLVTSFLDREESAIIVNSGSYGIAGMALRASLAADHTRNVVWLASGVDRLYPSGHDTLLNRVLDAGGAIVSAAGLTASPTKMNFQQAFTYQALSTAGVLIPEAGYRSRTLESARVAYSAGRFVGAVPGPITAASSAGAHELIKTGVAELVTSSSDIMLAMS